MCDIELFAQMCSKYCFKIVSLNRPSLCDEQNRYDVCISVLFPIPEYHFTVFTRNPFGNVSQQRYLHSNSRNDKAYCTPETLAASALKWGILCKECHCVLLMHKGWIHSMIRMKYLGRESLNTLYHNNRHFNCPMVTDVCAGTVGVYSFTFQFGILMCSMSENREVCSGNLLLFYLYHFFLA